MYRHFFKPLCDYIIGLCALPFLLLLTLILAPFYLIMDRGPIFYSGKRLGQHGKLFPMYKFRSMKVNAPDIRLQDGCTYSCDDDPRVTKLGYFLRKTSLDEIPQFLNLLTGQMSLIGPRPDLPDDLERYTTEEKNILNVKPGITGYNQAIYRNSVDAKTKLSNDLYYVEHFSFTLDCKIIFWTMKSVLKSANINRI